MCLGATLSSMSHGPLKHSVQYTITVATHIKYAIKMCFGLCLQPNSMSKARAVAQPVKTAGFIKMQAYLHLSDTHDVTDLIKPKQNPQKTKCRHCMRFVLNVIDVHA